MSKYREMQKLASDCEDTINNALPVAWMTEWLWVWGPTVATVLEESGDPDMTDSVISELRKLIKTIEEAVP